MADQNTKNTQIESSTSQPIDVNSVKIKLVILCKNKNALESSSSYLNRRGWETTVTTDVRALFKLIGVSSPDFVMLSVNAVTNKIAQMPKIITQTFNIPVITFGEASDTKTLKHLQDIRANYTFQGTASGPGLHRKIKAILQEMYAADEITKQTNDGLPPSLNEFANRRKQGEGQFESENPRAAERFDLEVQSVGQAKTSNAANENEDDDGIIIARGSANERKSQLIIEKGASSKIDDHMPSVDQELLSPSEEESDDSLEDLIKLAKANRAKSAHTAKSNLPPKIRDEDSILVETFDGRTSTDSLAAGEDDVDAVVAENSEIENLEAEDSVSATTVDSSSAEAIQARRDKVVQSSQEEMKAQAEIIKSIYNQPLEKLEPEKQTQVIQHIFEYCAALACQEKKASVKPIIGLDKCRLWPVEYAKQKGLLMIAHAGDEKTQKEYTHNFFKILNKEINERSRGISYDAEIKINLDAETLEHKHDDEIFTRRLLSGGDQVIIKLLPSVDLKPVVVTDQAGHATKGKIDIADLVANQAQGVNLYLHMPANEKYFLYLKGDTVLLEKQLAKLRAANANMFIELNDKEKFVYFVIRNKATQMMIESHKKKNAVAV